LLLLKPLVSVITKRVSYKTLQSSLALRLSAKKLVSELTKSISNNSDLLNESKLLLMILLFLTVLVPKNLSKRDAMLLEMLSTFLKVTTIKISLRKDSENFLAV